MAADSKPSCEQIIDIMVDPFVVIDRDYRIVAANRAYRERYGVEPGGVVGRLCHEVSHHSEVPCSRNGEHCPLEEVFERKQATQVMHVHFDRDGGEEYVQLHSSPLLGDDGEVRYIGETIFRVASAQGDDAARLIGRSQPLLRMTSLLQRVAPTQTTVLLLGESGVGKELVARAIHRNSQRSRERFVQVNCAAIPEELIESELFGHEKGSFTGATEKQVGKFEQADRGTIFLDEVGDMSAKTQAKVLRVLQEGEVERLGSARTLKVDVRVIAATNKDLEAEIERGTFREDLYFRLSVIPIHVPPLRERAEDIPLLVRHFTDLFARENNFRPRRFTPAAIDLLQRHRWKGNIRELKNSVERLLIMAPGEVIDAPDVRQVLRADRPADAPSAAVARDKPGTLREFKESAERAFLVEKLRENGWNISKTAEVIGTPRSNLYKKLELYGISQETDD